MIRYRSQCIERIRLILILTVVLMSAIPAYSEEARNPDWRSAFAKVATDCIPAVVHVEVTQKREVANPFAETDPLLRRFFNLPKMPKKFQRELKGIGSGILINPQGYILTNSHVASGASKILVVLADGREFSAKLIGSDPKTDLAVIQISGDKPFPYLKFADSDRVMVGQWVVAIGHPRGLDQTVTQGIISAMHRTGISDPSSYQDFLQTDAAINPGNSGGPLLNLDGAIVGVNSAIASASGGFEGIGFAIPSNMAFYVTKQLMAHGKVERGWLGVSVQDLSYEQARSLGLTLPKGALVSEVVKGGPAENAGLRKGDVILDYNNSEVKDSGELRNNVAVGPIGKEAVISVWRNGKKANLTARIENLDNAIKILAASARDRLGAEVRPVTAQEAEKYGMETPIGVTVSSLSKESPLQEAGIEVNDIILGINGQMIGGTDNFYSIIATAPSKSRLAVLILDHRSGNTGSVTVRLK
jgi:serine protease Do